MEPAVYDNAATVIEDAPETTQEDAVLQPTFDAAPTDPTPDTTPAATTGATTGGGEPDLEGGAAVGDGDGQGLLDRVLRWYVTRQSQKGR